MFWISDDVYDSPIAPARGVCNGVLFSMAFWFAVGVVVYWVVN